MILRVITGFLLAVMVAGACSQPQQETVTPETAASSTTESAVPPAEATPPVTISTTVPEAEVPPSTASPAGTAPETSVPTETAVPAATIPVTATPPVVTTVPEVEVLEIDGVSLFTADLTVEAAELVGVAVEVCRGAGVDPFGSGCAGAVWEVCYGVRSDIEEIRVALGDGWNALGSEQRDAFSIIGYTLCSAAFTAEVVELASVLAASYGGRYYRESRSIVDEERWIDDYGLFGGPTRFRGDLRDFADFRHYIETGDWTYASEITPDLNEEYALADYVSEAAYAVIKPLLKVLGRNVRYYSLRYSSMLPAEFDAGAVIRSAQQEERISEGAGISIGGLPSSPEDIVYYNPDDTCRRAAFDAYVYSGSSLKRESVFADTEGINIREAVFYLSQPLLLYNLPQHQRINDARYIEEY